MLDKNQKKDKADLLLSNTTLRQAFAMAAMQGILSNQYNPISNDNECEEASSMSVLMADALLKELAK